MESDIYDECAMNDHPSNFLEGEHHSVNQECMSKLDVPSAACVLLHHPAVKYVNVDDV